MRKLMRTIALTVACVLVFGVVAMAANSTSTGSSSATNDQVAKDAFAMAYTLQAPDGTNINPLNEDWLNSAITFANAHPEIGKVLTVIDLSSDKKDFDFSVEFNGLDPNKSYVWLHYVDGEWKVLK